MILVNVVFAETNHEYDFKADEQALIGHVVEEMVTMIAEEEHYKVSGKQELFLLCNPKTAQIFSPTTTLTMNGVTSGTTLLLV